MPASRHSPGKMPEVTQSEVRNQRSFRSAWPYCAANPLALLSRESNGLIWPRINTRQGWLKTPEAQRRISDLPRKRLELRKVEFDERFEVESIVAALRQLRQKALRFDGLRKKALDLLETSTTRATISPPPQAGCEP